MLQPSPLRSLGCNTLSHSVLANIQTRKRMFYPRSNILGSINTILLWSVFPDMLYFHCQTVLSTLPLRYCMLILGLSWYLWIKNLFLCGCYFYLCPLLMTCTSPSDMVELVWLQEFICILEFILHVLARGVHQIFRKVPGKVMIILTAFNVPNFILILACVCLQGFF